MFYACISHACCTILYLWKKVGVSWTTYCCTVDKIQKKYFMKLKWISWYWSFGVQRYICSVERNRAKRLTLVIWLELVNVKVSTSDWVCCGIAIFHFLSSRSSAHFQTVLLVYTCQTGWGIIFWNVRRVHRFIFCLNYMMFPLVLYLTPLLRQCIAIFVVAKGWLLLDIGWFVLF